MLSSISTQQSYSIHSSASTSSTISSLLPTLLYTVQLPIKRTPRHHFSTTMYIQLCFLTHPAGIYIQHSCKDLQSSTIFLKHTSPMHIHTTISVQALLYSLFNSTQLPSSLLYTAISLHLYYHHLHSIPLLMCITPALSTPPQEVRVTLHLILYNPSSTPLLYCSNCTSLTN